MRVRIAVGVWPNGDHFATGGGGKNTKYDEKYDEGCISDIGITCQEGFEVRWIDVEVDDHSSARGSKQ